jgi:hypothetical protein
LFFIAESILSCVLNKLCIGKVKEASSEQLNTYSGFSPSPPFWGPKGSAIRLGSLRKGSLSTYGEGDGRDVTWLQELPFQNDRFAKHWQEVAACMWNFVMISMYRLKGEGYHEYATRPT